MKLRFNSSAHATFLNGTFMEPLLPYGTHLMKVFVSNSSFWIFSRRTFTITEPSFKWRLTFLPRRDLAVFVLSPCIFSPFNFFFRYLSPTTPAYRSLLSFEENVNFNVFVPTFCIPRVVTAFHNLLLQEYAG